MLVEMYISTLYVFLVAKIGRKKQSALNTLPAGTAHENGEWRMENWLAHANSPFSILHSQFSKSRRDGI
jgi:hypothetical protein